MKMSPEKHLWAQRIVGALFLLAIVCSLVGFKRSPVAAALAQGQRIPLLLFGLDAADASQHTDTLMLAVLDPVRSFLQVLSIPRDTRVRIPGYRFRRVNEIYGYHMRKTKDPYQSAKRVQEGVEVLLSSKGNAVSVPHFVQVDYDGFRQVVDLVGGVWVDVKTPMHYDDNAGNYHFHKEPGRYLMDGDEALHYVRFRGATGDRGRIYRTQGFLRNMAKKMAHPMMVARLPRFLGVLRSSMRTNFSFWDVVYLSVAARKLRPHRMKFYILPGRPKGAYWKVKKESAQKLAASLLLGKNIQTVRANPIVPQVESITVRVWNASGRRGWARQVTRYLRLQGFDVVDWGNYAVNQVPTRVIDRTGKILKAQSVAESLGIESFHSEPNARAMADVEVIIGRNYNGIGTID